VPEETIGCFENTKTNVPENPEDLVEKGRIGQKDLVEKGKTALKNLVEKGRIGQKDLVEKGGKDIFAAKTEQYERERYPFQAEDVRQNAAVEDGARRGHGPLDSGRTPHRKIHAGAKLCPTRIQQPHSH
jgi:hypothetical protein